MAITPAWIVFFAAAMDVLGPPDGDGAQERRNIQEIFALLESRGWRLVPSWAVDEKILADALPRFVPTDEHPATYGRFAPGNPEGDGL